MLQKSNVGGRLLRESKMARSNGDAGPLHAPHRGSVFTNWHRPSAYDVTQTTPSLFLYLRVLG